MKTLRNNSLYCTQKNVLSICSLTSWSNITSCWAGILELPRYRVWCAWYTRGRAIDIPRVWNLSLNSCVYVQHVCQLVSQHSGCAVCQNWPVPLLLQAGDTIRLGPLFLPNLISSSVFIYQAYWDENCRPSVHKVLMVSFLADLKKCYLSEWDYFFLNVADNWNLFSSFINW